MMRKKIDQGVGQSTSRTIDRRLTIGYLVPDIQGSVNLARWRGVADVTRERGVNLICFPGWYLGGHGPRRQANAVYDLASMANLDGLVVGNILREDLMGRAELDSFFKHYSGIPVVSLRETLAGIPYLPLDNYHGMCEALVHLIEVHGYRRIAFLRGPEGHPYADERYRAYTDILKKYRLPFKPELVTPPSDWDDPSIRALLDERKLSPAADFEAVVAVNDIKALDALRTFQARGIRVHEDVAIVGFNDDAEDRVVTPSLTSVAMPFYEQGRRATEMVLTLLDGKEVLERTSLAARLVVRQSCGCMAPTVAQAVVGQIGTRSGGLEDAVAARREEIVAEMAQVVGVTGIASEAAGQLFDGFVAELEDTPSGSFLPALNEILRRVTAQDDDVTVWQGAVSVLRRHLLPYLADAEALSRADDLWHQARVTIGVMAERASMYQALQAERQALALREIGQGLIAISDVGEMMGMLAQSLPQLGIPGCYLSLYEDPELPTEWSRLILAYDEKGRVELEPNGWRFPSPQLVPELLPQGRADRADRSYSLVVESLYFQRDQLGFTVFEMGPYEGSVYEALRGEISSALQAASLIKEVKNRAFLVQTAAEVSQAVSSILDPRELIQEFVDLVCRRFDLYYAGLFLVEEGGLDSASGGWAVLQAGTGQAGRTMIKQKHRLEVGGNSMIGQCIANGEARIALDVGEEAVRFSNPLLPETRSELALPLISRGQAIGALTIQSSRKAAFTQEDTAIFQTMANQLANAIENVRLFKQAEEALDQVKAELRRQIRDGWSRYLSKGR